MSQIYIILSTYNGEKFLEDQLISLKNQTSPFELLVRDDGSTDRTLDILNDWKDKLSLRILSGPNISPVNSFNVLLQMLPDEAEYIFFCDQDDIWENDKIEKSVKMLKDQELLLGKHTPILFHSDLSVIDEKGKFISKSFWKFQNINFRFGMHLNRLVMQNTVTGCSACMNISLLRLVKEIPQEAKMHDWWVALVACCYGRIISTEFPLIRYRIHRNNVVGGREVSFLRILKTLALFISYVKKWKAENYSRIIQAQRFYEIYEATLPAPQKKLLEKFIISANSKFVIRKFLQYRFQYYQHGWYRIVISFFLF